MRKKPNWIRLIVYIGCAIALINVVSHMIPYLQEFAPEQADVIEVALEFISLLAIVWFVGRVAIFELAGERGDT